MPVGLRLSRETLLWISNQSPLVRSRANGLDRATYVRNKTQHPTRPLTATSWGDWRRRSSRRPQVPQVKSVRRGEGRDAPSPVHPRCLGELLRVARHPRLHRIRHCSPAATGGDGSPEVEPASGSLSAAAVAPAFTMLLSSAWQRFLQVMNCRPSCTSLPI